MDTEITLALAQLGESTDRLLATADALTDAQVAAPSRLPGWTRGHVLTHLARNADGFRNLLTWAGTGNETPMYPSEEARARDVEEGAGRSAAKIAADVQVSAAALAAAAQGLPARAWDALVARRGVRFPAREIPSRRLAELEIHHVNLDAGYRPADWPASFVAANLVRVARDFAGRADAPGPPGWPGCRLPDRPGAAGPGPGPARPSWTRPRPPGPGQPGDRVRPARGPAGLADRPGQRRRARGHRGRRRAGVASLAVARGLVRCRKTATQRKEAAVAYTGDVTVGGPPETRELPGLTVTKLAVGPMDNDAYLLTCTETGEAALIDAANEAGRLLDLIGDRPLRRIITTHRHFDHWQALAEVQEATGADVVAHPDDAVELPVPVTMLVENGGTVPVGTATLSVIHLRGHTPGSIALCYDAAGRLAGEPHLFTGDSLFPGGPGNTQGDAKRFTQLMDDLEERVFAPLPDPTWVYPGHGGDTTLGTERPHLGEWRSRGW